MKTISLIIIAALLLPGCAGIEFKAPERFKDKKQTEDPPLGQAPLPETRHA